MILCDNFTEFVNAIERRRGKKTGTVAVTLSPDAFHLYIINVILRRYLDLGGYEVNRPTYAEPHYGEVHLHDLGRPTKVAHQHHNNKLYASKQYDGTTDKYEGKWSTGPV